MGIDMVHTEEKIRLQKVIARAGISSRRKAEELIQSGQVTVNGEVITTLGTRVDPAHDHIKISGKHLPAPAPDMFLILNKPAGVVSTLQDPEGRPTIKHMLPKPSLRLFPVGRLDFDSEGLLLLTNNGEVAQACLHPSHHVLKTYLIKIKGVLEDTEILQLKKGLPLEDGQTAPAKVRKAGKAEANSWVEITIHEGRKHQVKRMLEYLGHPVIRLKRIQFGPLNLGNLPLGASRFLTDKEANALRQILVPAEKHPRSRGTRTTKPARWAESKRGSTTRRKPKT
ncbi:MAG: rRNA pseudouridine synthase [Nitrospira sp.]|nr:rRNA pseudouridine synthase [Nitrospira sp.]